VVGKEAVPLVVGSKKAVRLVVGSKQAVRLVGVGRPVHMAGNMHRGMEEEGMRREVVAGHTVAVVRMVVLSGVRMGFFLSGVRMGFFLSGVHMRYMLSACDVSLKNERNCINIKHYHHI
jgi:hypothetical protein